MRKFFAAFSALLVLSVFTVSIQAFEVTDQGLGTIKLSVKTYVDGELLTEGTIYQDSFKTVWYGYGPEKTHYGIAKAEPIVFESKFVSEQDQKYVNSQLTYLKLSQIKMKKYLETKPNKIHQNYYRPRENYLKRT